MYNFRELRIWQNARVFVRKIYLETRSFPKEERHGLTQQMRRAAVSIPCNIAEGCGRKGENSLQLFLSYSIASAFELETQLLLSADLNFLSEQKAKDLVNELQGLQKGIRYFSKNIP
jgi:four helix bundle protein